MIFTIYRGNVATGVTGAVVINTATVYYYYD